VITLTDKVKFYESVFGSGRMARNCKNFDVKCPICDPKDPSKKKLAIHTDDDRVHCWVCGYKAHTLAPLIRKYGSRDQLVEYRDRFMPDSAYKSRVLDDDAGDAPAPKLTLPKDFRLLATAVVRDPDVLAIRKYLITRKISERDLWYYKLGHSDEPMWKRRVIMPSFDKDGELNLFVGRAIDKHRKPKYEMPEGERKHVIFNEINVDWTRRLVLCEGAFDLMKCGENAVALLGSDLNEESALFNSIVANGTPIALAMDADMKTTKMPRVATRLSSYDIDVIIVKVPTDPGEMSKQEFKAALAAAQPYDWQQTFMDRLDFASKVAL
jgi:hypothetical protein